MRIVSAQFNSTLGDFAGNRRGILETIERAGSLNPDLLVFPELSLFGYPPLDLLERRTVVEAQLKELDKLAKEIPPGIAVIVGVVTLSRKKIGKPYHNSAALLVKGKKPRFFNKELLPTYDVFDEARFVERGDVSRNIVSFRGRKILITVCEDIWGWPLRDHPSNYLENPLKELKRGSCDIVINISASPFNHEKEKDRLHVARQTAAHFKAPLVYVNAVGAQDELIFDGGSFVIDPSGKFLSRSSTFTEDLSVFDLETRRGDSHYVKTSAIERTRDALVLGIRDFVRKIGLKKAHLGLSGGIDSAVVACLAVDALGSQNVTCVTMPGPFSAGKSKTLAERLGEALGVEMFDLPISESYETVLKTLHQGLGEFEFGLTNENLQSRLRGLMLMAFSNKEGSLLLTTGNKSEYATGYATLYGDMCGGLAPLGDLVKDEVFALARLYNAEKEIIPNDIIDRAPSAELRENQTDQDSLPPYPELDRAVRGIVEEQRPLRTETERWLLGAIARNEFKRWQAPPILKVSKRAFGRGRRYPIVNVSRV